MTGSYDGTIKLWDERNMKNEHEEISFGGKSVWDVKFNYDNDTLNFGIAAIYDGYLFSKPKDNSISFSTNFKLSAFDFNQYTGHQSICYSFEFIPHTNLILTSSFYDSTLHLIQYALSKDKLGIHPESLRQY